MEEQPMQEQYREILIPKQRVRSLKENWKYICENIINTARLDIRFNVARSMVEMKTNSQTENNIMIQRAVDFVDAVAKGFEPKDAVAFLKIENLRIDSFMFTDVKLSLQGDHLGRAVGRVVGSGGKVKNTLENATKTRLVVTEKQVHIMGQPQACKVCKDAVCDLVLGQDIAKVYNKLRIIASKFNAD